MIKNTVIKHKFLLHLNISGIHVTLIDSIQFSYLAVYNDKMKIFPNFLQFGSFFHPSRWFEDGTAVCFRPTFRYLQNASFPCK